MLGCLYCLDIVLTCESLVTFKTCYTNAYIQIMKMAKSRMSKFNACKLFCKDIGLYLGVPLTCVGIRDRHDCIVLGAFELIKGTFQTGLLAHLLSALVMLQSAVVCNFRPIQFNQKSFHIIYIYHVYYYVH